MGYERMHSYRNRPFWNLHISGLNTILCFISSVFLLSDFLIVYFVLCNSYFYIIVVPILSPNNKYYYCLYSLCSYFS
jgi:hypothetical protein